MHVWKTCVKEICPDLQLGGWEMKTVIEVATGKSSHEDIYNGIHKMEAVSSEKYLGDILSSDGKNLKNISARKDKGIGIVTKVMEKLNEVCFGKYFFKVGIILRNCNLISSHAEAWYNVTQADIDLLERF